MARPSSSSSRSISRSVARSTLAAAAVFLAAGFAACAAGGAQGCALCDPAAFTGQSPRRSRRRSTRAGPLRRRGASRMGAGRRGPLLQPGEGRILRRGQVLPGHRGAAGAVRDARRSEGPGRVARRRRAGRSGHARKRARHPVVREPRPDTRTTQLFINLRDNSAYDRLGFAPFAEVVSGMDIVDGLYAGYQERPEQPLIDEEGNGVPRARVPQSRLRQERRQLSRTQPRLSA